MTQIMKICEIISTNTPDSVVDGVIQNSVLSICHFLCHLNSCLTLVEVHLFSV